MYAHPDKTNDELNVASNHFFCEEEFTKSSNIYFWDIALLYKSCIELIYVSLATYTKLEKIAASLN